MGRENALDMLIRKEESGRETNVAFDREVNFLEAARPKWRDFKGVYPPEKIVGDKKKLKEIEERQRGKHITAERLEKSVMLGNDFEWNGEDCIVIPAHQYDDKFNGTDAIECYTNDRGPSTKLLVDVTTEPHRRRIQEKIMRIGDGLEKGKMPSIEYFHLEGKDNEPKGRIIAPRVIVGTGNNEAYQLYQDFCQALENKKGDNSHMVENTFQRELTQQKKRQLVFYLERAVYGFMTHYFEKDDFIRDLRDRFQKIDSMELDDEMDSQDLREMLKFLVANRERMFKANPLYTDNIFAHLDVLRRIDAEDIKKGSQGISRPGAINDTERMLEIDRKKDFISL